MRFAFNLNRLEFPFHKLSGHIRQEVKDGQTFLN